MAQPRPPDAGHPVSADMLARVVSRGATPIGAWRKSMEKASTVPSTSMPRMMAGCSVSSPHLEDREISEDQHGVAYADRPEVDRGRHLHIAGAHLLRDTVDTRLAAGSRLE